MTPSAFVTVVFRNIYGKLTLKKNEIPRYFMPWLNAMATH